MPLSSLASIKKIKKSFLYLPNTVGQDAKVTLQNSYRLYGRPITTVPAPAPTPAPALFHNRDDETKLVIYYLNIPHLIVAGKYCVHILLGDGALKVREKGRTFSNPHPILVDFKFESRSRSYLTHRHNP